MKTPTHKILLIIAIQIIISLIHIFRLGQLFSGKLYILYYSYFSDLIIPFGFYFLLSINEFSIPFLRDWRVKSIIVFSTATTVEICQFFDMPVLGVTFDPIDIIMFGAGVIMAVLVDKQIFAQIFKGPQKRASMAVRGRWDALKFLSSE